MNRYAVCIGLTALAALVARAEFYSQEFVERQYDAVVPGVCLLEFSSEVTNQATGEVSKRDTRALGVLVSPDGLVMAHGHMQLENTQPFNIRVKVGQGDGEKEYDGVLLKKPDDVNVCFVRIEHDGTERFPYLRFARDARLDVGEPLLIFGLMGETLDFARGVSVRMVGAVLEKPRTTYAIDQSMPFGYVGGPVVNSEGKIAGVVGFDLSMAEGGDLYVRSGHPLVYQTDLFAKYIANPPSETEIEKGEAEAWLGVFSQPLTDDLAEYWGLPRNGGIVVSTIVAGSPADVAGLQRGDVLTHFDGTPLTAKLDREIVGFTKLVRETGIKEVSVRLLRDGEPMEMSLMLTERPKAARDAGEYEDKVFGLTVREITTDVRILLNLSEDVQGVIVRRVKSGSWANLAHMVPGLIIMRMGDYPVTNLEDFKEAIDRLAEQKPAEVPVFCRAGARTGFFRLQPRWERNGSN